MRITRLGATQVYTAAISVVITAGGVATHSVPTTVIGAALLVWSAYGILGRGEVATLFRGVSDERQAAALQAAYRTGYMVQIAWIVAVSLAFRGDSMPVVWPLLTPSFGALGLLVGYGRELRRT